MDNGHSLLLARSTEEALNIPADSFDWAIVDVMLPNDEKATGITNQESRGGYLSGIALTRRLRTKHKG